MNTNEMINNTVLSIYSTIGCDFNTSRMPNGAMYTSKKTVYKTKDDVEMCLALYVEECSNGNTEMHAYLQPIQASVDEIKVQSLIVDKNTTVEEFEDFRNKCVDYRKTAGLE